MKIKIINTLPHDGPLRKILFSTPVGFGIAFWANEALEEGGEYNVELDINDNFIWGSTINSTLEEKDKFEILGDITKITANITSNEDNGLAIELQHSIALVETNPSPHPLPRRVELSAKHITLYSIEY